DVLLDALQACGLLLGQLPVARPDQTIDEPEFPFVQALVVLRAPFRGAAPVSSGPVVILFPWLRARGLGADAGGERVPVPTGGAQRALDRTGGGDDFAVFVTAEQRQQLRHSLVCRGRHDGADGTHLRSPSIAARLTSASRLRAA